MGRGRMSCSAADGRKVGGPSSSLILGEVFGSAQLNRCGTVSLPSTPVDTHGHDKVLVRCATFRVCLDGGCHIVVRYQR